MQRLVDDAGLLGFTDKTATALPARLAQLAQEHARGMARSAGKPERGRGSCAAAVFDHRGQAMAAVNVTGLQSLFTPATELAARIETAVTGAAARVSKVPAADDRATLPA